MCACVFFLMCIMVNFTCQVDWPNRCLKSLRVFLKRLALDSGDWGKRPTQYRQALSNLLRARIEQKRKEGGIVSLSSWTGTSFFSGCPRSEFLLLGPFRLQDLHLQHPGSQALGLRLNYTTCFHGSPVCRWQTVDFLVFVTSWVNPYNKSPHICLHISSWFCEFSGEPWLTQCVVFSFNPSCPKGKKMQFLEI